MLYVILTIGILMVVVSFIIAILNIVSTSYDNMGRAFNIHGFCMFGIFFGMLFIVGGGIPLIINFIQSLNQTTL